MLQTAPPSVNLTTASMDGESKLDEEDTEEGRLGNVRESGMSNEAMLRYQKARIRVLSDELNHSLDVQREQEEKIEKLKST